MILDSVSHFLWSLFQHFSVHIFFCPSINKNILNSKICPLESDTVSKTQLSIQFINTVKKTVTGVSICGQNKKVELNENKKKKIKTGANNSFQAVKKCISFNILQAYIVINLYLQ